MKVPNPTGKGGFKDNPQNKANGMWTKDTSISYQYNYLIRLPIEEFEKYKPITVAQKIAHEAVKKVYSDLGYLKEVTDRTDGKPSQPIDHTTQGEKITEFKLINYDNDR